MPGIFCAFYCFIFPTTIKTGLTAPISQKNTAKAERLDTFVGNHTTKKQQVQASELLLWLSGHRPILRFQQMIAISLSLGLVPSRTKDGRC